MDTRKRALEWLRSLHREQGSQIIEFAVALPLLVVCAVGIFDFGGAFNLKQKLNAAAREGARQAISLPTNDLDAVAGTPTTVNAIMNTVDSFLVGAGVNDCGLNGKTPAPDTVPLSWTYTATSAGCPGTGLTLKIERGYATPATVSGASVHIISTRVTITYPYVWHFNNVIQLLVPGASYAGTTYISTDAVLPNLD